MWARKLLVAVIASATLRTSASPIVAPPALAGGAGLAIAAVGATGAAVGGAAATAVGGAAAADVAAGACGGAGVGLLVQPATSSSAIPAAGANVLMRTR